MSDYHRIEKAMAYISEHSSRQPTLEEVAVHVYLSPFHFQRVFCRWAGTEGFPTFYRIPLRYCQNFGFIFGTTKHEASQCSWHRGSTPLLRTFLKKRLNFSKGEVLVYPPECSLCDQAELPKLLNTSEFYCSC